MNNPIKSQIAANRERFDEKSTAIVIANEILDEPYTDPDSNYCILARQFLRQNESIYTSQTSLLQTSIAAVEGFKPCPYNCFCSLCQLCDEDTHIHCGDCVMGKPVSALSKVVELLKGGIEII